MRVRQLNPFLAAIAVVTAFTWSGAARVNAGSEGVPVQSSTGSKVRRPVEQQRREPAPTVKWKVTTDPHLVSVGPMRLRISPVAGPLVRRPPLLPPPKVVIPEAKAIPTELPSASEPSTLSADANPILLPPVPAPDAKDPVKPEEPKESVLVPSEREQAELKDAVKFFEPPQSSNEPQIALPAIVPHSSPATQPSSRATYRKEKE